MPFSSEQNQSMVSNVKNAIVQVVLLKSDCQYIYEMPFQDSLTVDDVVESSQLLGMIEEEISQVSYGIYGKHVSGDRTLVSGDRIEIIFPLVIHPRDARKLAYANGRAIGKLKG
jgi:putative ubiquitin-RnfH superfamily antitoxin RatB of RatAB toxin-antitoxin module